MGRPTLQRELRITPTTKCLVPKAAIRWSASPPVPPGNPTRQSTWA